MNKLCITLRPIKEEDCDLLFEWLNDREVRQMSFDTKPVLYDEHKKWFSKVLYSTLAHIFIICVDEKPVGQIRINIEKSDGIISFSIDKNYRGRGYGSEALRRIIDIVKEQKIKVNRMVGKVKYSNMYSRKAFHNADYKSLERQDYIEFYKEEMTNEG